MVIYVRFASSLAAQNNLGAMFEILDCKKYESDAAVAMIRACQSSASADANQIDLQNLERFYFHGNGNFWVAIKDQKLVGTAALLDVGGKLGMIKRIFVSSEFCGVLGQKLFDTIVGWATMHQFREIWHKTTKQAVADCDLCEANGFVQTSLFDLPPQFHFTAPNNIFYRKNLRNHNISKAVL